MPKSKDASEEDHLDEEGIASFLTDAIGPNADKELLKDFGDSNAFAELLEVVTSSLIPSAHSASNSRRNSTLQEDQQLEELAGNSPLKTTPQNEDESKKRKYQEEGETNVNIPSASHQKIHNRLKIRGGVHSSSPNKSTIYAKSTTVKDDKRFREDSQSEEKRKSQKSTAKKELLEDERNVNLSIHKKCIKRHRKDVKRQGSSASKSEPCCVILYDIMKTDKFFQLTTPSSKSPHQSSSSSNNNLYSIKKEQIDKFHEIERKYRLYYANALKPPITSKKRNETKDEARPVTSKTSQKIVKHVPEEIFSTKTKSDKHEMKHIDKKVDGKTKNEEVKHSIHKQRQKGSDHAEQETAKYISSEVSKDKTIKETTTKEQVFPNEEESMFTDQDNSPEDDASVQHVQRNRERDETKRDKKFEKFENERQRKDSKTPKDIRIKRDGNFSPSKPLPQSFRIPKQQGGSPQKIPRENTNDFKSQSRTLKQEHSKNDASENRIDRKPCKTDDPKVLECSKISKSESVTPRQTNDDLDEHQHAPSIQSMPSSVGGQTIPPPPLSQVQIGDFAVAVTELLKEKSNLEKPTFESFLNNSNAITEKCAWWFSKCDKEKVSLSEQKMPWLNSSPSSCASDEGNESFSGNISNEEAKDCQVNEISSTSHRFELSRNPPDPDKIDEFCGRSLLQAKIRIIAGSGQNFQKLFDLRSGALYEKQNFQARCNLCNQLIIGKIDLARHVRSSTHKDNLRKIDSQMDQSSKPSDYDKKKDKNRVKRDILDELPDEKSSSKKRDLGETKIKREKEDEFAYETTSTGLRVKVPAHCELNSKSISPEKKQSSKSHRRHRSRSKSRSRSSSRSREKRGKRSPVSRIPRSPKEMLASRNLRRSRTPDRSSSSRRHSRRSRSRSRSPRGSRRRRSTSEEYRNRRSPRRTRRSRTKSKSPPVIKKDNREFHEKLALTAEGKWTAEMENQWGLMETEEAMFREQFIDRKKILISAPEEHPKYGQEWTAFWERRYQEVEKEGKDPDTYNYVGEWKDYWAKKLNVLLQEEADEKIRQIKIKYKMDFDSLKLLRKTKVVVSDFNNGSIMSRGSVTLNDPIVIPHTSPLAPQSVLSNNSGSIIRGGANSIIPDALSAGGSVRSVNVSALNNGQKVKSVPRNGPGSAISVEQFTKTWEAFTRPKIDESARSNVTASPMSSPRKDTLFVPEFSVTTPFSQRPSASTMSDTTSSSDASDLLGFDLVQVLRLMCKTEDQLSFLAPKVIEFYKMAEELELKKSKGSHVMLDNEELVTVMFQARDRFMSMIRSNILPRETLKTLNLTVFGLNAILDVPQCQRFRPKVPLSTEITAPAPVVREDKPEEISNKTATPNDIVNDEPTSSKADNELVSLFEDLSTCQKNSIASEIAKYLLLLGGQEMPNKDLKFFVKKLVIPLLNPKESAKKDDREGNVEEPEEVVEELSPSQDKHQQQPPKHRILGHDYTHSVDMRVAGVVGTKDVGSALPSLSKQTRTEDNDDDDDTGVKNSRDRDKRTERDLYESSSSRDDGRRSPFSRREMVMNPLAERGGRY